jgi:mannose-6-phosphate isomerase
MAVERARAHSLPKPWGVADLRPFSDTRHDGDAIGEIWFERADKTAKGPSLLLKLLFTSQPLSIQVHPDDAYAQSIGLPNGKTEAWYILNAAPDAKIAFGLKRTLTPSQLRQAIEDGSIRDLVVWRAVSAGETILVPAGTIHAIGAGLVLAEIQQRSDATFRIFDFGRGRELHIENAIAVADAGPAELTGNSSRLTDARMLLTSTAYFTFEKIELAPNSIWRLEAEQETWMLVVNGTASVGTLDVAIGSALFAQSDWVTVTAGPAGLMALIAYTGNGPSSNLLECLRQQEAGGATRLREMHASNSVASTGAAAADGYKETTQ